MNSGKGAERTSRAEEPASIAIIAIGGLLAALCCPLIAQQVVAPTPAQVGPLRGENVGGYNVVNSFETGYRFRRVGGDLGLYRANVNYGNGIRLLGSSLTVHSRDGHGRWFDEIVLTTLGLGNDPYQYSNFRVQKNRLYRYDMQWRLNEYFNPALTAAGLVDAFDTRRRLQDHDLVLLPQSRVRLFLGYTRNSQTGPALTSVQLFDSRGDEFPLFADIRRVRNEYRLGGDIQAFGARLTWLHRWDYFKDDTPLRIDGPSGGDAGNGTALTQFHRVEPYHGASPGWLVNLKAERRMFALNGRFTYVGSRRNFIFDEFALGADRFGAARNRQLLVFGTGRRPVTAADLAVTLFPGERLTVTNNTSFHNTRMGGDGAFRELVNSTLAFELFQFRSLGIRALTNSTDAQYRLSKWLSFRAGYQFSRRELTYVQAFETPALTGDRNAFDQENTVHAGVFGVRIKPLPPVSINLDAEIGRADRPFTPISERNYHALGARAQYRAGTLLFSAAYRQNYNFNSVALSTHSARSRNYSADASWAPRGWIAFDLGYARLHLDTASFIAFFANNNLLTGHGLYRSEVHSGNAGVRLGLGRRVDVFTGYSLTRDAAADTPSLQPLELLARPQVFPLRFESPLARLSIRLHEKFRWNAGYQFYRYREDQFVLRNYRAHTGYTSILWSF